MTKKPRSVNDSWEYRECMNSTLGLEEPLPMWLAPPPPQLVPRSPSPSFLSVAAVEGTSSSFECVVESRI